MSKLEVNAVEPQCGTNLTLGASGDTIIIPAGANATLGGPGSTITIPSGATISNQGTAAGFGPTGAVSWDTTKKTTGFTAVSGVGYFCDTTSAAFTVTLPATPAAGAVVGIADYANTFATNNITVGRNGSKIGGVSANATLSTNGLSVTFVYVDATQGWIVTDSGNRSDLPTPEYIVATGGTITCDGDYKIHTFTGPGTFTVCSVGNPAGSTTVNYLVVAGGGGAGSGLGGGGGAGGYRTNFPSPTVAGLSVTAQGYPITVGSGGAAGIPDGGSGNNGNNSVFSTITSAGGGGSTSRPAGPIGPGGSGGGGGGLGNTGGTGNTPPTSPPQGNPGGSSSPGGLRSGGGGGGASAAGGNFPGAPNTYAVGGAGSPNSISGSAVFYAGGGGGGGDPGGPAPSQAGGSGGGGQGGQTGTPGIAGTVNTGGGGGGGGGGSTNAGAGGSGIVVIRYKFQ